MQYCDVCGLKAARNRRHQSRLNNLFRVAFAKIPMRGRGSAALRTPETCANRWRPRSRSSTLSHKRLRIFAEHRVFTQCGAQQIDPFHGAVARRT